MIGKADFRRQPVLAVQPLGVVLKTLGAPARRLRQGADWAHNTSRSAACQVVDQYLIPGLGRYPVDRLRPDQVQAFLNAKGGELSPRSVHHLRAILRTGLANAVRWGAMPRNVATLTDPPRVPAQHATELDPAQADTLLRARGRP